MNILEISKSLSAKTEFSVFRYFFRRFSFFSVFFNTDVGVDFGFLKYRDIGFGFRLPTRLYCRPHHPTPQVFQTDIESRQTHSQCHRPCQLSEVTNVKLSWMKRMRFSFAGPMLDRLPLEIINYYTNYVRQQSTKSTASHTYRIISGVFRGGGTGRCPPPQRSSFT